MTSCFDRHRQIGYFAASLRQLPSPYCKLDTNRLTLVHFCVQALDLLGVWEDEHLQISFGLSKQSIIAWIYSLQTTASAEGGTSGCSFSGFKGGHFLGDSFAESTTPMRYDHAHIAMSYTALCTLKTLGDDWSRVDREGIIRDLKSLQLPDGSFKCIGFGSEHDMRFLYCACCISYMLDDWSAVNKEKAVAYVKSCRGWDGGIALLPNGEAHGGSTFCGTASLLLMDKLDEVLAEDDWRDDLIRWCVHRQVGGMQGRPNKAQDTCYSYWIGGTLRLLGEDGLLDHTELRAFVMQCQTKMGGFGKVIGAFPDVLHSYYSMSYLSLSQKHLESGANGVDLKELDCTLGFGNERTAEMGAAHP